MLEQNKTYLPRGAQMHKPVLLIQLRERVGVGDGTGRSFGRDLVDELGERGRRRGDDHFGGGLLSLK